MAQIECDLARSLHKGSVRLSPQCIKPCVKLGSETCDNYCLKPSQVFINSPDVTNTCQRAQKLRKQPPIDSRIHKKAG